MSLPLIMLNFSCLSHPRLACRQVRYMATVLHASWDMIAITPLCAGPKLLPVHQTPLPLDPNPLPANMTPLFASHLAFGQLPCL